MRRCRLLNPVPPATRLLSLAMPALLLVTAGCALGQSVQSGSLAGACQMRACECAKSAGFLGTSSDITPVEWQTNGDAACPDGYRLRTVSR